MTHDEVSEFEQLQAQLQSLCTETAALSRRKPDDAVNQFKLGLVNQVLERANSILGESNRPFADFLRFDSDDIPTNSDVLLVLSQYLNCLEKLRADNTVEFARQWYWVINGERSKIRTAPPRKLKY